MTVRVGVNGFGRIGRLVVRAAAQRDIEVVGVNDIMPVRTLAHLLRYDSTYGRYRAGWRWTATRWSSTGGGSGPPRSGTRRGWTGARRCRPRHRVHR